MHFAHHPEGGISDVLHRGKKEWIVPDIYIAYFQWSFICSSVWISSFTGWKELGDKASELEGKQILLPLIPVIVSFGIFYYF
jgi:hypothetical protein